MKCTVCGQDYSNALRLFTVRGYDRFYVNADVLTAETVRLIFEYAQINELDSFTVNAEESKLIKCAGCQELNIEQKRKRRELLNLPEFSYVNKYDFL